MKKVPPTIMVIAILNLIFGGFGFLCFFCSGLGAIFFKSIAGAFATPGVQFGADFGFQDVPGYMVDQYLRAGLGVLTNAFLILSGIGLLRLKAWGRGLGLAYGIITIVSELGLMIFHLYYLNPAIGVAAKANVKEAMAKANSPANANAAIDFVTSTTWLNVVSILTAVVLLIYPIIVVIILSRRSVTQALNAPLVEPLARPDDVG
jgi:hypothetical protein